MDGKTRRFKNGNPAAYKDWTDTQWEGLSERDKAMWVEYNDEEPAPIPQDVIDFTKENDLKPCCEEVDKCKKLEAEVERLTKLVAELSGEVTEEVIIPDTEKDVTEISDEEAEKDLIKAKLTELGVPFRSNTGLKKLKEKLELAEDANNTE